MRDNDDEIGGGDEQLFDGLGRDVRREQMYVYQTACTDDPRRQPAFEAQRQRIEAEYPRWCWQDNLDAAVWQRQEWRRCKISKCQRPSVAQWMCTMHHQRWLRQMNKSRAGAEK